MKERRRPVKRAAMAGDMVRVTRDDEELGLDKGQEFTATVVTVDGFVQVSKGQLSKQNYVVLVKY